MDTKIPKVIAVIGANGQTGRIFVEQALNNSYIVHAGIYGPNDLKPHQNLKIYQCDSTNPSDVEKLLKGTDMVVSLIGHGSKSPKDLQTKSMQVIADVMKNQRIKRLISLTGTAVKVPGDKPKILNRLSDKIITIVDPVRVKDGINHYEFLKTTDLDWTIIRVTKLTNQPYKDNDVLLQDNQPGGLLASRYKVARAILALLKNNDYIKALPVII